MALSALEQAALDELSATLRGRFGGRLTRVALFGSRARGEGHADSDLDVLVLVRGLSREERREVIDVAGEIELEAGLVLSPVVRDADAWRDDLPLARAIARDGAGR